MMKDNTLRHLHWKCTNQVIENIKELWKTKEIAILSHCTIERKLKIFSNILTMITNWNIHWSSWKLLLWRTSFDAILGILPKFHRVTCRGSVVAPHNTEGWFWRYSGDFTRHTSGSGGSWHIAMILRNKESAYFDASLLKIFDKGYSCNVCFFENNKSEENKKQRQQNLLFV